MNIDFEKMDKAMQELKEISEQMKDSTDKLLEATIRLQNAMTFFARFKKAA